MFLKYVLIFMIINHIISYLDTDCYKDAGDSVDICRKFTTFINGEGGVPIEENILYLCCYVDDNVDGQPYKGCRPVKEDIVFAEGDKPFKFECSSFFMKTKQILMIIGLFITFL